MSDAPKLPDDSVSRAQRIDEQCDAFESAWGSGQQPSLEDALAQAISPAEQDQLLRELLPIEIFHRVKCGEQPSATDYAARFPVLDAAWIEQVIARHAPQLTAAFQPIIRPEMAIAGRYSLKQKLGEGGMGEVWVAKQTEPVKRNVALKLIKTGMDSRAVLARFEAERQALALMEHPNIAHVLDGGITASGQPFFVMELVNGLPLNKFCDEAKLTLQQRLELFVPICQAVQHAHHKGIVHRDLKPSNILVTLIDGRPVPKVIDFGVAKATAGKLTDESLETQFGAVVGTLEYMSPEQAGYSGADIDTRADIYSLGVILYELLTGLRPIDAKRLKQAAYTEMLRIIKEEEPSKPSTRLSTDESLPSLAALRQTEPRKLMAILRGELDWVVMKCLEKDRNRRYETANSLARDIEHYLADEPVEARPPSTTYRLSKFLLRNKGPVLAASLLLLALVAGIVGTTWGMLRAEQQQVLAERQRIVAEQQRGFAEEAAAEERLAKDAETEQRKIATQQTAVAQKQSRVALANQLAAQSNMVRAEYPERSALLAVEAVKVTRASGEGVMPLAQEALRESLTGISGDVLARDDTAVSVKGRSFNPPVALSASGQWMALVAGDRTLHVWDLANQDSRPKPIILTGLGKIVGQLALSGEGQKLVAWTSEGDDSVPRVLVWDLTSQSTLPISLELTRPPRSNFGPGSGRPTSGQSDGPFGSVAISTNGRWVLSHLPKSEDALLWDLTVTDGQAPRVLPQACRTAAYRPIAFSPDGHWLATFGTHNLPTGPTSYSPRAAVLLWDLSADDPAKNHYRLERFGQTQFPRDRPTAFAFSPDGHWLASGDFDGTVTLWDVANRGAEAISIVLPGQHQSAVWSMAFSGDSTLLATAGQDHTVRLWHVGSRFSGTASFIFRGHEEEVAAVAFSPNSVRGRIVSASADGVARTWTTAQRSDPLTSPVDLFGVPVFSPDGKWLVTGSGPQYVLNLTQPDAAFAARNLYGTSNVMAISSNSRWFASSDSYRTSGNTLRIWDLSNGPSAQARESPGFASSIRDLDFSPDGRWLVAAYANSPSFSRSLNVAPNAASLILQDLSAETAPIALEGQTQIKKVTFSPDSRWLASAGAERESGLAGGFTSRAPRQSIRLLNLTATEPNKMPIVMTASEVSDLQFSPDSQLLFSVEGTAQRKVFVWDVSGDSKQSQRYALEGDNQRFAISGDGRSVATASATGTVRLWKLDGVHFRLPPTSLPGHSGTVNALAFSSDSHWLVTAGDDGTVRRWNITADDIASSVSVLRGHEGAVKSVALSSSRQWLASYGQDEKVCLWDCAGQHFDAPDQVLEGITSATTVVFSPDSRWLLLHGRNSSRLWPVPIDSLLDVALRAAGRTLRPDELRRYGIDRQSTANYSILQDLFAGQQQTAAADLRLSLTAELRLPANTAVVRDETASPDQPAFVQAVSIDQSLGLLETVDRCQELARAYSLRELQRALKQASGSGFIRPTDQFAENLNLTDEQSAAIRQESARLARSFNSQTSLVETPGEGQAQIVERMRREQATAVQLADEALQEILQPDQFRRVKELFLQRVGSLALVRDDLATELALTQDQRIEIARLKTAFDREERISGEGARWGPSRSRLASLGLPDTTPDARQARRDALQRQLLDVLTVDQRGQWEMKLGGPPIAMLDDDPSQLPSRSRATSHRPETVLDFLVGFQSTQSGGYLVFRRELGLTDQQHQAVAEIVAPIHKEAESLRGEYDKQSDQAKKAFIAQVRADFRQKWAAADERLRQSGLLSGEQYRRVDQFFRQASGPAALMNQHIAAEIQLSADQERQIADLWRSWDENFSHAPEVQSQRNGDLDSKILGLLTPAQTKRWQDSLPPARSNLLSPAPSDGPTPLRIAGPAGLRPATDRNVGESTPLVAPGIWAAPLRGDGIRYTVYWCMALAHEKLLLDLERAMNRRDFLGGIVISGNIEPLRFAEDLGLSGDQWYAINEHFSQLLQRYGSNSTSPAFTPQSKSSDERKKASADAAAARQMMQKAIDEFKSDQAMQDKLDADVKRILTPQQRTRAEQLTIQRLGILALTRPSVAAALALSKSQQEEIKDIAEKFRRNEVSRFSPATKGKAAPGILTAWLEAKTKTSAELESRLQKLLSTHQQQLWAEKRGPPVVIAVARQQWANRMVSSLVVAPPPRSPGPRFRPRPVSITQVLVQGNPQPELDLTADQQLKVSVLAAQFPVDEQAFERNLSKLETLSIADQRRFLDETQQTLRQIWTDADAQIKELQILSTEQWRRAHQIFLHAAGPSALLRDDVAQSLQLSSEQRAQMRQLTGEYESEWKYLNEEQGQRQQAYEESLIAVLASTQRETWNSILGAPPQAQPVFPGRRSPTFSGRGGIGSFGGSSGGGGSPGGTEYRPPANQGATTKSTKSIADYDTAIRQDPSSAVNFYNRATALERNGEISKAIADYSEAIRLNSKHSQSFNALARILATSPDDNIRDGKKAIEHATSACELTEWKFPAYLDTLAAAHAEAGNFDEAIKWATKAIELATGSRKVEYKVRLELYQSNKPYHQAPAVRP